MATDVSIVIAYRDLGDAHRRASFDYVHMWYARLGWEVIVEPGPEPFSRARALNAAIRKASGKVIVQSDPDSVVPDDQLFPAVRLAADSDGLVVPHNRYLYLTEAATVAVLARGFITDVGPADCDEYGMNGFGNVTVFSRSTWELSGGFDERFGMYGGDDACFAYSAAAFCRPTRRIAGDMVHLWHPRLPQSVPGHPGYSEQFAIVAEYRDAAATGPAAVRDLVRSR
jgi:glycosyltransferase involved in cell wall biosynthesis